MILSAQSIRKWCTGESKLITPFVERSVYEKLGMSYGLSSAGYDIRIGRDVNVKNRSFALGVTMERFHIPNNILMRVHDKSTWARKGLMVQNTVGEPGWTGYLTLELSNETQDWIFLEAGTPIAQVVFELLDESTEQVYAGKYQNQIDFPVSAKFEEK